MATENSNSSGWSSILDKALDVAGDVLGSSKGVATSTTPQPVTQSATAQPAAGTSGAKIPQWVIYTAFGILAVGGSAVVVALARR